jgi:lysophospholipase L1-like esterase
MTHAAWQVLLCLIVLGFPLFLARRGRGNLALLLAVADLLLVCGRVLLDPDERTVSIAALAIVLLVLGIVALFASPRSELKLVELIRSRSSKVVLTLLFVTFVPLGSIELTARVLSGLGILKYHQAIQTVWRSGHDDWRLATITGDDHREPDPVLLWRPVARKPFNSDRFKGPEILDPKPNDVIRVICYGDSLTDGPPKGGWPRWLEIALQQDPPLAKHRFEVLNAGVAGYSSHQGVLRFLQEVDTYQPDLLLVSFGWNDAAEAIGQPDKTFQVPPWPLVALQRALVRYRSYLVLMYYTRQWRPAPPKAQAGKSHPRVSREDYLANMERFRAEAESRGIPIAFLTRPHKVPAKELAQDATWRGLVPSYNEALRDWTARHDLPLVDLERAFEALPSSLFSDECHFISDGYQKMAEIVRAQLEIAPEGTLRIARQPPATLPLPRVAAPGPPAVRR